MKCSNKHLGLAIQTSLTKLISILHLESQESEIFISVVLQALNIGSAMDFPKNYFESVFFIYKW